MRPDDPNWVGNPVGAISNHANRVIPLSLHGDGITFTQGGNKLLVVSMSFLLASGWSSEIIWMLAHICAFNRAYQITCGVDSWNAIWKQLAHGFEACMNGEHPKLDANGIP